MPLLFLLSLCSSATEASADSSHNKAALDLFEPTKHSFTPQVTIEDVFASVQAGQSTYGVVPFENSTNGAVTITLDLLADKRDKHPDIDVCGEIYIPVHHCLLGRKRPSSKGSASDAWETTRLYPGTTIPDRGQPAVTPASRVTLQVSSPDNAVMSPGGVTPTPTSPYPASSATKPLTSITHVTRIHSHPQAWGQCKVFMSQFLKGADRIDTSSTSAAASAVANDESGTSAAVCSALAAKIYGLDVLARDIEDSRGNTTRFFVLRRLPAHGGTGGQEAEDNVTIPLFKSSSTTNRRTRRRSSLTRNGDAVTPTPTRSSSSGSPAESTPSADSVGQTSYKTCIAFTVPHATSPGALASTLSVFAEHGINLTSINTRPSGLARWHYTFFVEFAGKIADGGAVDAALRTVDALLCESAPGRHIDIIVARGGGAKCCDREDEEDSSAVTAWWRVIGSWENRAT